MKPVGRSDLRRYAWSALLVLIAASIALAQPNSARASLTHRDHQTAVPNATSRAFQPQQQLLPESCADVLTGGRQLAREEREVGPSGTDGRATLCLLRYPENAVAAVFLGVDSPEQFDAAKSEAIGRLRAAGVDPCEVVTWGTSGWPIHLELDDNLAVPGPCAPRVIAGDPGAAPLREETNRAASDVASIVAGQLEWPVPWPITIVVMTDPQQVLLDPPRCWVGIAQVNADAIRAGRSASMISVNDGCGAQVLLNFAREYQQSIPPDAIWDTARAALIHEYSHLALQGLSGMPAAALPRWYTEGLVQYMEQVHAGGRDASLLIAAQEQQAGRAPRLGDLGWPEAWATRERVDGQVAVYTRSYVALMYLIERYGLAATLRPLRANHGGTPEGFLRALSDTLGMDLDALDRALSAWLAAPGRELFRDDFSDPRSGWPRQSTTPGVRQGYEEGEYTLAGATGVNTPTFGITYPLRDFIVELDARLAPPMPGAIIFVDRRRDANNDHYCWQIDLNGGAFTLVRIQSQDRATLIPLTRSAAIRQGGDWNHFAARLRGSEIVLVVNGQEVGRATDEAFSEGAVGVSVGSATGGASGMRFDNFVVRNPD